jgi:hypothetical protein
VVGGHTPRRHRAMMSHENSPTHRTPTGLYWRQAHGKKRWTVDEEMKTAFLEDSSSHCRACQGAA